MKEKLLHQNYIRVRTTHIYWRFPGVFSNALQHTFHSATNRTTLRLDFTCETKTSVCLVCKSFFFQQDTQSITHVQNADDGRQIQKHLP